ncbi:MAG: sigma-70 family RNA polymerase sigma factor [Planctomycetales bacterium]|nr:sigma-70 family RNA polymerase sigma factor [Planctomycetales bacterium]
MNHTEIIDGLRKRDPRAARDLNEYFVPSVWRFVFFRVGRDSHLAEDIVAEVVLALMSAVTSDTSIESPAAWMRTVAQRRIQDHFRAVARVRHLIDQAQHEHARTSAVEAAQQDPAIQHDQELRRQRVRDAMNELPDNYRMALEWKYVDRLTVKEIAKRMDTTEKSAESILFRARQALRSVLAGEDPNPPPAGNTSPTGDDQSFHDNGSTVESRDNQRDTFHSDESSTEEDSSLFIQFRLAREN